MSLALAAVLISGAALITSIIVALKQHSQGEAAAKIDGRFLAIEETRFQWDREARERAASVEGAGAEPVLAAAVFGIRFGFRDSAHTRGRLIARNNGPADARDVSLQIGATVAGRSVGVEPVRGTDYSHAALLRVDESVHVGVAFTFGSPGPEDLTYTLRWTDDRGQQEQVGRVPLD